MHADWKHLTSVEQLQKAIDASTEKPIMFFKHSTRCGISHVAQSRLVDDWGFNKDDLDCYYIDLLKYREVSKSIEDQLGIYHQSPQVIIIKDKRPIYNSSHHTINIEPIRQILSDNKK